MAHQFRLRLPTLQSLVCALGTSGVTSQSPATPSCWRLAMNFIAK